MPPKYSPKLYQQANSPDIVAKDAVGPNGDAEGMATKRVFRTQQGNGKYKYTVQAGSEIHVAKATFSSALKLASTIGHELNHMMDYVNGNHVGWLNKYKDQYAANTLSEINAYGWEGAMNSPFANPLKLLSLKDYAQLFNWKP